MKPPETVLRELVIQWLQKADQDFAAAAHLVSQADRFREIVAFHCQQAAEKYLKAVLVQRRVEFPKTHDIRRLLESVATIDPHLAQLLREADTLTPFGVEVRYPSDAPELPPGGETEAFDIARRVRDAVMAALRAYLEGG
jgi:HEPN domain-containing protein